MNNDSTVSIQAQPSSAFQDLTRTEQPGSVIDGFWERFRREWDVGNCNIESYKRALYHGLLHMYDEHAFGSVQELKDYLLQQSTHGVVYALVHVWEKVRHLPGIERVVRDTWTNGECGSFAPHLWEPILRQVKFPPLHTASRLPKALKGDSFTVYRGGEVENVESGFSWTLSRNVAVKFATSVKYDFSRGSASHFIPQRPVVLYATARADDVLWYENGRKEQECVMSLDWVKRKTSEVLYSYRMI